VLYTVRTPLRTIETEANHPLVLVQIHFISTEQAMSNHRTIKVSDDLYVEAAKFDFKPKYEHGHEGYMWKQGNGELGLDDEVIVDGMYSVI